MLLSIENPSTLGACVPPLLSILTSSPVDDVTRNSYAMPQVSALLLSLMMTLTRRRQIRMAFEYAYHVLTAAFSWRSGPRDENPAPNHTTLLSHIITVDDDIVEFRSVRCCGLNGD